MNEVFHMRHEVLEKIKHTLICYGFKPDISPNKYQITISTHPQNYLRKESYTTRRINDRLIYSAPELEGRYKSIRDEAEGNQEHRRRNRSSVYQAFFSEITDILYKDKDYIIFPLDEDYLDKRFEKQDYYAKISRYFYIYLCREAEDGRTVAAQAYYYLCGVYHDNQKSQWAMTFEELYGRKHITEYFPGIHVVNNKVEPSDKDDVPCTMNKQHDLYTITTKPCMTEQWPHGDNPNAAGCLGRVLFVLGSGMILLPLLTYLL